MLRLSVKVGTKYVATASEVGIKMSVVVIWLTDLLFPKRHDLHQALSAGSGDRTTVKSAFHLNNREHPLRRQGEASRPLADLNE